MWPREFTTMTQCLPAVTSVYHKTAILFIIFCCCCWTFPYLLSKVPCSLSEFISVICLTTCVDLIGLTNKGTWLKSLTFGAKIKCHAYLWVCGLPVYLNKICGQSTIDSFSKNRLINKLIIIVSTREKKGLQRRIVCRRKFLVSPLQENIVRSLKQTPIANRVIL